MLNFFFEASRSQLNFFLGAFEYAFLVSLNVPSLKTVNLGCHAVELKTTYAANKMFWSCLSLYSAQKIYFDLQNENKSDCGYEI